MKRLKIPFGLSKWDTYYPQKVGSDSEPSRGRLQPSRRAERDFLRNEERQRHKTIGPRFA